MTPFLYVGDFGPERTRIYDVSPREGFAFHFRFKPEEDDRFLLLDGLAPSHLSRSLDVLTYTTIKNSVSPSHLNSDRFLIKPAR